MTFNQELKIWDAASEADFDGWQLRYVEKLPVDSDERAVLVTALRRKELQKVHVNREVGRVKFVKALEDEWIDTVNRENRQNPPLAPMSGHFK